MAKCRKLHGKRARKVFMPTHLGMKVYDSFSVSISFICTINKVSYQSMGQICFPFIGQDPTP